MGLVGIRFCNSLFTIAGRFYGVAFHFEIVLETQANDFFVFYDEYFEIHGYSAFLNLTVNVDPLPGLLTSEMVALWVSATRLTVARPSPEPLVLRVISSPTL
jgi:hypothetical protein